MSIQSSSLPGFGDFGLHVSLLEAIAQSGYTTPTPIQAQSIAAVMAGHDVMGAAQTGTGKTAAFTLPLLNRLMPFANHSASPARHPIRALILTPTRELADQVAENVARYASQTPLRTCVVYGGVPIQPQQAQLLKGCEVLIATPGRLLDHLEQKNLSLGLVGTLVLDEADRMLDMGFLPDLLRILKHLPPQRQSLLFSATFSADIRQLARQFLRNPVEITVATQNATASTVTQQVYQVPVAQKKAALLYLLETQPWAQSIVFSNTKMGAAQLARDLARHGLSVDAIHGDRSQADRTRIYEAFKSGKLKVLIATDVAARGLDVAGLDGVINYDLPYSAEDYVHRIGRTGRAGCSGEAIAFYSGHDEKQLAAIQSLIGKQLPCKPLVVPTAFLQRFQGAHHGEGRSATPLARPGGARAAAKRRTAWAKPAAAIDPFFYTPYVETPEPPAKFVQAAPVVRKAEPLAVLLGGRPMVESSDAQ